MCGYMAENRREPLFLHGISRACHIMLRDEHNRARQSLTHSYA
jgi:hypothetical protein